MSRPSQSEAPPTGSAGAPTVVVQALAKLTLSLRVIGVRPDGYHLLDSEMVTIDLADTLSFSAGDGLEVHAAGVETAGVDRYSAVPSGPDNLVSRALALVGRRARVRLEKRIPPGGGLGGGSADAAAVLRWAGCRDLAAAATLGADVVFCLVGGRARVTGIGEVVAPLPFEEVAGRSYTLLIPPFGVGTAEVYRRWDLLGSPAAPPGSANDLELAALAVQPRLARWRDALQAATGRRPALAGSGATWFVEGAYPGPDRVVVRVAEHTWPGLGAPRVCPEG